ncbi:MAG: 3-hydroxyacyl-CoA dehydrogenase/enoyl-CoA hydratase family protein, partial [Thermoanaerobaculia bacterium]
MTADSGAIQKVGVLGSGVMGAGIAAHVANAGIPVVLLDIAQEGPGGRSALAMNAIERLKKTKPSPLMAASRAKLITPGNLDDDLALLADCDWIIEAVIERVDIKQNVFRAVDGVRKAGSIVSSNTSTIPFAKLMEGLPAEFARDFLITHFFNPPRYMRLLELVAGPHTRPEAFAAVKKFCDLQLGKSVVVCKDTPAFIANRIGTFWIESAIREAFDGGLTVEEVDALAGKAFGFPKTGVFGLLDLVGIDLGPHVAKSLLATLPKDDLYCKLHVDSPFITKMIADGLVGRKGKGGFYRMESRDGKKVKQAIDLQTGEYRDLVEARLASIGVAKSASKGGGPRAILEHPDRGGRYCWKMIAATLSYALEVAPQISDDLFSIDEALRTGFSWKWGPFELLDKIGPAWFAGRLRAEGLPVPALLERVGSGTFYRIENGRLQQLNLPLPEASWSDIHRGEGVLLLSDIKLAGKPVSKNSSASLWDLGDGVLCLEFTSKMNSIDEGILRLARKAIALVGDGKGAWKALVISNEGENFSVGANIGIALFAANIALWMAIEGQVYEGQQVYKALKYAPFPVVGAPSGMALGGGCEILLHCSAVQAHAE